MKYLFLFSFLTLMFNMGVGQETGETEQTQTKSISMESKFLGLRTAAYFVANIDKT